MVRAEPYSTAPHPLTWQLLPSPGVKYLQVWAVDGAGNIALMPASAFINYAPPQQAIRAGQSHLYRYTLTAGQLFTARVEPISGDPDLYGWAPDSTTRPLWVSNLSSGADEISFAAPMTGIYQVEVYGYSVATYQMNVTITETALQAAQQGNLIDGSKPLPLQPLVASENQPSVKYDVRMASQPAYWLYLPTIQR